MQPSTGCKHPPRCTWSPGRRSPPIEQQHLIQNKCNVTTCMHAFVQPMLWCVGSAVRTPCTYGIGNRCHPAAGRPLTPCSLPVLLAPLQRFVRQSDTLCGCKSIKCMRLAEPWKYQCVVIPTSSLQEGCFCARANTRRRAPQSLPIAYTDVIDADALPVGLTAG